MQIKRFFHVMLVLVLLQVSLALIFRTPSSVVSAATVQADDWLSILTATFDGSNASVSGGWDRSSVSVTGKCSVNDEAVFYIKNTGSTMTGTTTWRLYVDDVLTKWGTLQLDAGERITMRFSYPGQDVRLEVDQRPGHPGHSLPQETLHCGKLTQTPTPDETPTTCTPEPTTVTPEPTTVTPEPTTVTPEPTTVTPEPTTVTPEPTTVTPEPTTVTPEPTTVTPEPTTVTPEPTTVTPEPTTETPTPETPTPETPTPTTTPPPEFYCLSDYQNVGEGLEYLNDFDGEFPANIGWSDNYHLQHSPSGQTFLGEYGNENVTLRIGCFPPGHQYVRITFDLYLIRSWDGNTDIYNSMDVGPDHWRLGVVDGAELLNTTFTNWDMFRQAYPGNWPDGDYQGGTNLRSRDALGFDYSGALKDSVYRISYIVPHTEDFITFDFSAWGLQPMDDESWGLDNFQVTPMEDLQLYFIPMLVH